MGPHPNRCPGCGLANVYPGKGFYVSSEWTPNLLHLCDECGSKEADAVPACSCGRGPVGNLGTHCLECELEPFGVAWELEQMGEL